MSLKCIFQDFWPQVQNSYFEWRAPFDGFFWQYRGGRNTIFFWQILISSEKPLNVPVYSIFETPSNNENSFKKVNSLLQTLCKLIVSRVTKEGEFYNKYLDWGCGNKRG